jgi:hypothetical protein
MSKLPRPEPFPGPAGNKLGMSCPWPVRAGNGTGNTGPGATTTLKFNIGS